MSQGEMLYLAMVVIGAGLFTVTLLWESWRNS
jgi:hypothetical protein